MMCTISDLEQNDLLEALPNSVLKRWLPQMRAINLAVGQVLVESNTTARHVYFPTSAIVSMLLDLECGASTEVAAIGRDGVVGVSLFMGGNSTLDRAVVQSAGQCFSLPARAIREEFEQSGVTARRLLLYTQALITQTAQNAACNRYHSIDQQLCRWLLQSLDRVKGRQIVMTQELMASLLGVRRSGVTVAAHRLQAAEIIRYSRGRITVLDRHRLECRACECYSVVRAECERLAASARTSDPWVTQSSALA